MAAALISLYEQTNGEDWHVKTGWLQGEPCVDSWHGVWCCPETHPILASWRGGGCLEAETRQYGYQHDSNRIANGRGLQARGDMPVRNDSVPGNGLASTDVTLLQPALDFPLGCHSGLYTGTQNDTARCVVVALELPQNNVRGDLDGVLDTLPWLQTIDVSDNRLGGPLPSPNQPGRVLDMRFAGNRFHYEEFDVGRVVNLCRISARCTGMPPISCQAFGKNYELMITDPNQCVGCPSVLSTTVFYGAVLSGLVIIGIVIVIFMIRDPEHMDEWISTIFIFVGHTQTLTIIGLLRLAWPVSAEKVTSSMGLDLANLGGSKPECFLQALTEEQRELLEEYGGSTFVTTMGRMIVVAFLLVGVTVTQSTIKRCCLARRRPRRGAER